MYLPDRRTGSPALTFAAILAVLSLLAAWPICTTADDVGTMLSDAYAAWEAGEIEKARALFEQIVEKFPGTNSAGKAYLFIARCQLKEQRHEEALATLDKLLEEFSDPWLVGTATMEKVSLLTTKLGDYEQAIQLAEEKLPVVGDQMELASKAALVTLLACAYEQAGQPAKALAVYNDYMFTTPALLTYRFRMSYYEWLFNLQVKTGKTDEALSTARLGYAVCPFNQTSIENMGNLVRKAFVGRGELFKATQFFAAQEDPQKPNPLLDVPMPALTDEQFEQMLKACRGELRHEIGVYLYASKYKEAMMAAQDALAQADAGDMIDVLNEVARVFKAKDLNLVRANQFLNYAKTGEGGNPLAAFWEEVGRE